MSESDAAGSLPAFDAFICHATSDGAAAALSVVSGLEARGLRCWIAPRNIPPGMSWPSAIVDGIERSRATILVLSAGAVRSPEVEKEVTLASHLKKAVLPLRTADVALSGGLLFHLQSRQWRDLFADPEGTLDEVAAQLGSATPRPFAALTGPTPVPLRWRRALERVGFSAALLVGAAALLAGAAGFLVWRSGGPDAGAGLRSFVVRLEDFATGSTCTGLMVGGNRVLTTDYCVSPGAAHRVVIQASGAVRDYSVEPGGEAGATSSTVLVTIRDPDGMAPRPRSGDIRLRDPAGQESVSIPTAGGATTGTGCAVLADDRPYPAAYGHPDTLFRYRCPSPAGTAGAPIVAADGDVVGVVYGTSSGVGIGRRGGAIAADHPVLR